MASQVQEEKRSRRRADLSVAPSRAWTVYNLKKCIYLMDVAFYKNRISDQVVSQARSRSNGPFLKKLLTNVLNYLFGIEVDSASKLYQKYATSFVLYINSRIPFRVPLNVLKMSKTDSGETLKSVREEMGLDRLAEGDRQFDGFDVAIKQNFDKQDEISSSMLEMTRSLKASTMAANHLVKRDIRRLNQAKNTTEGNMEALKQTSDKLATCSKDGMNWGLIVLVIVVFMIFMFMVFLMRVLKKN